MPGVQACRPFWCPGLSRERQGRVQLDSDWNEEIDILKRRIHTTTLDILGPIGVPYAEGFITEKMVGVRNFDAFVQMDT